MSVAVKKGGRHFAALLFALGFLQIAGYWFSGAMVNGNGPLAIPQPDTLLYLQAARRVAEGHPFSFTEGAPPCTGTTSVLHQFVLAPFYLLGAKDSALVTAGFVLNAIFYLVFLGGWGYAIWRRIEDPLARWLAGIGVALFGQIAYSAFAQSDIGMWLAVSALLAAGLASGRRCLFAVMLLLGPWVRPEGMVCVIAFAMVLAAHEVGRRVAAEDGAEARDGFGSRADWLLAAAALLSMAGVFALNWALTGHAQFSSVANKGYFTQRPFSMALYFTACDLLNMVRSLAFGVSMSPPRQFYFIPVVGCAFLWIGVIVHQWRRETFWREAVYLLAIAGGLWTVANSGWQNTNVDRYIAWVMPPVVVFSAEGAAFLFAKLRERPVAAIVPIAQVAFAAGVSVAFWALFHSASFESDLLMKFGRELGCRLPDGAAVGLTGYSGLAYPMANHKIVSINGIYSPELSAKTPEGNLEALKYERGARFDYWLFAGDDKFAKGFMEMQDAEFMNGPEGISVRKADWSAFDRAAVVPPSPDGKKPVWRVDVGYEPDETQSCYEVETRYGMMEPDVVQRVDDLAGAKLFECGRVIYGGDSMFVPLEPGKDCRVVMRTALEETARMPNRLGPSVLRKFEFASPLGLNVAVDGEIATTASVEVGEKGFSDVAIEIPGNAIRQSPCRISFLGDHAAYSYWFFQ